MGVRFEVILEPEKENVRINRLMYKDSIMRSLYYHMKGYPYYKVIHDSKFKPFTFSHLIGQGIKKVDDTHLTVSGELKIIISTIDECLARHWINSFSRKPLLINSTKFITKGVNIINPPDFNSLSKKKFVLIKSIEPVNVVRGVVIGGKLREYDVKVGEADFISLLKKSVINKLKFMGFDTSNTNFTFQVEKIIREMSCSSYTDHMIKRCGSMLVLRLLKNDTPDDVFSNVLKVTYYTGLGHNTSKGFGLIDFTFPTLYSLKTTSE